MSDQPGILHGLNRQAMEAERLARLATRKRGLLDQLDERPTKISKPPSPTSGIRQALNTCGSVKLPSVSSSAIDSPDVKLVTNKIALTQFTATTSKLKKKEQNDPFQYPTGVIKKTWAFGHDRCNDIKIEEVLQKKDLTVAVLSSFQWHMEWLFSKFNVDTKLVFVMQAKDDATKAQYLQDAAQWSRPIRVCFPPMPGQVSCMHSKLMLLFHPEYLRVVVPTANLTNYDWGETGVMENTIFLIDLPRIKDDERDNRQDLTPFADSLLYFLNAMGLDEQTKEGVLNFDFSKTKDLAFIHTVGGLHVGAASRTTGFPLLSHAVRSLNLSAFHDAVQVDFVASSIGALNEEQIKALYRSLRGLEPVEPTAPSKKNNPAAAPLGDASLPLEERFRIIFPSQQTVAQSTGGPDNAGTICLSSEFYDRPTFPRELFHDCIARRSGLLSHNKIIFVRTPRTAYVYTGSANLSQSAWGTLSWDRTAKAPKLNCRNWECGVLVPVVRGGERRDRPTGGTRKDIVNRGMEKGSEKRPIVLTDDDDEAGDEAKEEDVSTESERDDTAGEEEEEEEEEEETEIGGVLPMDVFNGVLDIPFAYPAKKYDVGQKPWFLPRSGRW